VRPAKVISSSGVSSTRSGPNCCCRPAVARNTPPLTPTSSPSTTTLSSWRLAYASAWVIASIRVMGVFFCSAIALLTGNGGIALRGQVGGQLRVQVIEHRFHRLDLRLEVGVDLLVHLAAAFLQPRLFLLLVPVLGLLQVLAQ